MLLSMKVPFRAISTDLHVLPAQIMILLAGLLPNPQVTTDTTGIFLSICSLAYMAPLGLASAASTRVANALGAKR